MSKPIHDIDDARLARALAHPLRIRILSVLERGTASPKEIAAALGVKLEGLSYHVRALRDFGFVELEERRIVRGAVEHRYRLAARPALTAEVWQSLPEVVRDALVSSSLDQMWEIVADAFQQGCMERPECVMARMPLQLDNEAYLEASAATMEYIERLKAIEARAADRLKNHSAEEMPTTVIAMMFETPDVSKSEIRKAAKLQRPDLAGSPKTSAKR